MFRRCVLIERKRVPIPLSRRSGIICHRIEDKVKPLHRVFKTLILTERNRDQHRDMKEQFPVVASIRTAIKVDTFRRIGLCHHLCGWIVQGLKQCLSVLRLVRQLLTATSEQT